MTIVFLFSFLGLGVISQSCTAAKEQIKKLCVAAYCRVSTETEEQNSSYEVQVAHYTEYIKKIMNGSLPASLQMMVSPGRTLKSVTNLIV